MRTALVISATAVAILMANVPLHAEDAHDHDKGAAAAQPARSSSPNGSAAQLDEHMKQMQAVHQRLMAAKTPEERESAMKDARKAMQDCMAMMHQQGMTADAPGPTATPK